VALRCRAKPLFHGSRPQRGTTASLRRFVPTTISSFGLKTGSPTAGRQGEISFAWLVKVSGGSDKFAGPFAAFDATGYDYGGTPISDALQPGIIPAAWVL